MKNPTKISIIVPTYQEAGNIPALAEFVLRCHNARDRKVYAIQGINQTSRPTLHGLACLFCSITDIPKSQIDAEIQKRGLYLGATVEFDPIAAPSVIRNVFGHDAIRDSENDR